MKTNKFLAKAAILTAAAFCGCSETADMVYRPYPQILPQHVTKLAVRPFTNRTEQFGLEDAFNLQLVQSFQFDGTYPIINESDANGVITGEIWRYTLMPIQYNAAQVSTAYKLTVMFKVRFIDIKTNTILWEEPAIEGVQIYSDVSLPGGMTELAARQAIWERAAQDIVTRTIAGFGSVTSQSQKRIVGGPQDPSAPLISTGTLKSADMPMPNPQPTPQAAPAAVQTSTDTTTAAPTQAQPPAAATAAPAETTPTTQSQPTK